MRVGVISDIHGNLHALQAVLDALSEDRPDAIWCLGDLVGYGPRPNDCCTTVARSTAICLVGNHDLGVIGRIDLDEFSPDAATAAIWSRDVLTREARTYLSSRKTSTKAHRSELFHASPRDPVWEYVLSEESVRAALRLTSADVVLVGHSHVPLAFTLDDDELEGDLAPAETEIDLSSGRWLLNPGSVGQPRDHDPRAAYLLLDFDAERAHYRRVSYPVERTQEEIRERGLPIRSPAVWLSVCSALLALGGCGGETTPEPVLPAALAETMAVEAEAVAANHDSGDPCGAAARARRLQRTTIAAIGDVPPRFQEQLQGSVNDLVDRSARACAASGPPPGVPAPVDVPTPPPPPALAPLPNVQPGKLKPGKLKPGKSKGKRRKHDDDEEDED